LQIPFGQCGIVHGVLRFDKPGTLCRCDPHSTACSVLAKVGTLNFLVSTSSAVISMKPRCDACIPERYSPAIRPIVHRVEAKLPEQRCLTLRDMTLRQIKRTAPRNCWLHISFPLTGLVQREGAAPERSIDAAIVRVSTYGTNLDKRIVFTRDKPNFRLKKALGHPPPAGYRTAGRLRGFI